MGCVRQPPYGRNEELSDVGLRTAASEKAQGGIAEPGRGSGKKEEGESSKHSNLSWPGNAELG